MLGDWPECRVHHRFPDYVRCEILEVINLNGINAMKDIAIKIGALLAIVALVLGVPVLLSLNLDSGLCLPAFGLVAVALLAYMLRSGVDTAKNALDWWTQRQMALDVHRVAMKKAKLDLRLVEPTQTGVLPVARHMLHSGALTQQTLVLIALL